MYNVYTCVLHIYASCCRSHAPLQMRHTDARKCLYCLYFRTALSLTYVYMCMYTCVCICVCMYVCMYVCIEFVRVKSAMEQVAGAATPRDPVEAVFHDPVSLSLFLSFSFSLSLSLSLARALSRVAHTPHIHHTPLQPSAFTYFPAPQDD